MTQAEAISRIEEFGTDKMAISHKAMAIEIWHGILEREFVTITPAGPKGGRSQAVKLEGVAVGLSLPKIEDTGTREQALARKECENLPLLKMEANPVW